MLYRGMDRAQLDAAYNNSAAVPERDAIVADWVARSAKLRREYAGRLDLAYGDTPRERLDRVRSPLTTASATFAWG
jgi:arylformamidase